MALEKWYSIVRNLKDESEFPYNTEKFTHTVLHDLKRMRIRDKDKFKQRIGVEFTNWTNTFNNEYSSEFISAILGDDEFWNATIKLTL